MGLDFLLMGGGDDGYWLIKLIVRLLFCLGFIRFYYIYREEELYNTM